jgi:Cu+-exporting ATPase
MSVEPTTAAGSASHAGRTYYFCSTHCLYKFEADPTRYVTSTPAPAPAASPTPAGAVYTCPMHPEVRQDHPGSCPKCGMALEPETGRAPTTRVEYTCPMHP